MSEAFADRGFEGVTTIVVAAGRSARMGGEDKLWADLGGRPLLAWSLASLGALPGLERLVVVTSAAQLDEVRELLGGIEAPASCVEGGATRRESVAAGLAAAPEADWYLVHDGARPLVSRALALRVVTAARDEGAAVPGLVPADTIKQVDASGSVVATPPRAELRAVQTPQAFGGALLRRAHQASGDLEATDDAALVEALGEAVVVVEGDPAALKVTTPDDLERVRALVAGGWQADECESD